MATRLISKALLLSRCPGTNASRHRVCWALSGARRSLRGGDVGFGYPQARSMETGKAVQERGHGPRSKGVFRAV